MKCLCTYPTNINYAIWSYDSKYLIHYIIPSKLKLDYEDV